MVADGGAHPTACPGKYETDYKHLDAYVAASKDEDLFQQYLDQYIFGPKDHEEYLEKVRFNGRGS